MAEWLDDPGNQFLEGSIRMLVPMKTSRKIGIVADIRGYTRILEGVCGCCGFKGCMWVLWFKRVLVSIGS